MSDGGAADESGQSAVGDPPLGGGEPASAGGES